MSSDIIKAAQKFKRSLLKENDVALRQMARTYGAAWHRLKAHVDAVSKRVAIAKASGLVVNPAWLFQQYQYRELMYQCEVEILRFTNYAAAMVGRQQHRAILMGEEHSQDLMIRSLGPMPKELVQLGYGVTWNRAPREALQNLVGFLGNGSPLAYKFAGMAPEIKQGVKDAIAVGFATGQNPRTIAGQVQRAFKGALHNTLATCRTETMRAYRTASLENYRANSDIVSGWIRLAAHNGRVCIGCMAQDGTFHTLDEQLDDHTNGRCTQIPMCKSWSELAPDANLENVRETSVKPWNAIDEFRKLSPGDQLKILGPTKLSLLNSGKIEFSSLATLQKSKTWGDHYRPTTVKELIDSGAITREDARAARVKTSSK